MDDSLRAFIALPVAPEVVGNVVRCQQELAGQTGDQVRWTPREQMHLTLQFLGNISSADVEQLQVRLQNLMKPLRLQAHGLGAFPSFRNPRVLWVGLAGDIDELKTVQAAVEHATGRREDRPFHPHLTIGRVREGRRLNAKLDHWKDHHFGEWEPRDLLVMQSKLSPKGATHSVIAKFTAK